MDHASKCQLKIMTIKLKKGGMTKPSKGSVDDLTHGAAIVPVLVIRRGVYINDRGFGLKLALRNCLVATNLGTATNKTADIDISHMPLVVEDSDDEEEKGEDALAVPRGRSARPASSWPRAASS